MKKGVSIAVVGTISWTVLITTIITILVNSNSIVKNTISTSMQMFIIILIGSTLVCFVMSFVASILALIQYRKNSIGKSFFIFLVILNVSYLLVFISILIYYLSAAFQAMMGI
ncbi:hypothetical protein [Paenibacillus sp. Soil522]|uniref:hypothetical protein n=1 Tax=Paenibacillus sp. Soil522 TaxID=1736388 RepID=UPI0006F798E8|nr:hypothetical protein [Paenibacillus sp. Soil522]KRE25868.1 hypothetical protein ASG81_26875 [Paenibacillus sp. Soil522]